MKKKQHKTSARHCPRPRITTADHVTPQLRQCRLQKEKRPASAALMVTRLTGFFFFLFFFSSWISTDTLCHLKTIFPTASVHTEGNYHLANQVRQTHGDFFGSHDLLRDLRLSHSLESVTCFGFIQSTVSCGCLRTTILQREHFQRLTNTPRAYIHALILPWFLNVGLIES